jgi:hypothetical protein
MRNFDSCQNRLFSPISLKKEGDLSISASPRLRVPASVISSPFKANWYPSLRWSLSVLLSLGLTLNLATVLRAEKPESAPANLKALLSTLDSAANRHDLSQVMQFYSANFENADGLTHASLEAAIKQLWKRYPDLQYTTQLLAWNKAGDELVAETLTTIQGKSEAQGRTLALKGTIKSRQYVKEQKLVRQEILAERTEVTAGSNPPQVDVSVPEKVRVGETFDFDVIVKEPLGNDLLVGTAIDEKAEGDRYLKASDLELEALQAGGLFKRVKAPDRPEDRWLSAFLVREGGMILVTQRVKIEK